MNILKVAWDNVSCKTIVNCFKKANFHENNVDDLEVEYDDDNNIDDSFEDDNIQTTEHNEFSFTTTLSNDLTTTVADDSSESETEEEVSSNEVAKDLFTLQWYFKNRNPEVLSRLFTVELDLYKPINDSKKQTLLTDFFSKI
jgi:hypothetical protein